jgi:large subunit ribosomal protein L24
MLTPSKQVNAMLPDFLAKQGGKPVVQVKASIPISAIRLVHPITDPQTGVTRDTIIRELQPVGMVHDRPTRKVFWSRLVPGLNVRIPWPKVPPKKHEDYPADTLRLEVEERTFVPTLLRPPMPETVIDELRNRYSKFRTRHTPEYIAKIEAQEAEKKVRKQSVESMLLPVQEYNRKLRELRRQRGKPELTTEMLEKIGEIIVKNKLRRSGDQLTEAGAATTDAQMGRIQSAVAQLSIGAETPGASSGEEQPRAS